ncbi:hypothetical protein HG535_0H01100 [Zygotorulaspora mrakii]|uniref:BRCT domain-containing protein n=1 Tax=Zygotorulaspora mrakii TaxID=42260 RepID=A0A7H9B8D5_ZYGMR|nr:uncharacterized protein HG535_0H01100 [Zygotorulaspora mrakii]QLG74783.1 hypothetical protein HG535_0H01100 [Zygotorulaspora mrakii]
MKPFHDITFCPTGIESESVSRSISKKIFKLGGNYSKDLTRQVNVLICGSKSTNKYKFSVRNRHDILFIDPDAIDVLYRRWLAGDDIGDCLKLLRERYSNKPLTDFLIFIGRIHDKSAQYIQELERICQLGSCYKCYTTHFVKDTKTFQRGDVVFVSSSLEGTRVQAALEQGLPIVHYKWLLDCHRRNATLEYDPYYLVTNIPEHTPFEKIGIDSCDCWDQLSSVVPVSEVAIGVSANGASATAAITGNPLTRFKSQGDKIWEKVMAVDHPKAKEVAPLNSRGKALKEVSLENSVFENCSFEISNIFETNHRDILQRVIEQNGGIVSESPTTYHIIPSNAPLNECELNDCELNDCASAVIITEFFIERCLHYKKIISPPDTWSRPFLITNDVQLKPSKYLVHTANQALKVAITGFHGVELLHLSKILQIMKPMGIELTEYLNSSADLLIINLSALSSIPKTHALWRNCYGDLFALQETNSKNQILRNSMKRKIEFIKQSHSIPGVTPSFLFDIFKKSSYLSENKRDHVYLNNINWCIICPRGIKDNFMIELSPKVSIGHKKEIPFNTAATGSSPHIKEARLEFLEKIKESESVQSESRKRTNLEPDLPSQPLSSTPIKKVHSNVVSFESKSNSRPSSWGNIMSDRVHEAPNKSMELANDQPPIDSASFTQVTYGTTGDIPTGKAVRKLTKKHIKDIGI